MSMAMRVTSHTRGAELPHLGHATDRWLQRTCRIVQGTDQTVGQLGSTKALVGPQPGWIYVNSALSKSPFGFTRFPHLGKQPGWITVRRKCIGASLAYTERSHLKEVLHA